MGKYDENLNRACKSICKVRKEFNLGCKGCVLNGYRECLESNDKDLQSVGNNLYDINQSGTYGSRVADGYIC